MESVKRDKRKNLKISETLHYDLKLLSLKKGMTMLQVLKMLVAKELVMVGRGKRGIEFSEGVG